MRATDWRSLVSPSALMFGSTIALFAAFMMLIVLPPGPASGLLVVALMFSTIVMGTMLLGSQRSSEDQRPSVRLTGRSSFSA